MTPSNHTVISGSSIVANTISINDLLDGMSNRPKADLVREKLVEMGADENCLKLHDLVIAEIELDARDKMIVNRGGPGFGLEDSDLPKIKDRRAELVQKIAKLRCDLFGDDEGVLWLLKHS